MKGSSTGLGLDERDTAGLVGSGGSDLVLLALREVLDGSGLHGELDEVHGKEPDDVLRKGLYQKEKNSKRG